MWLKFVEGRESEQPFYFSSESQVGQNIVFHVFRNFTLALTVISFKEIVVQAQT